MTSNEDKRAVLEPAFRKVVDGICNPRSACPDVEIGFVLNLLHEIIADTYIEDGHGEVEAAVLARYRLSGRMPDCWSAEAWASAKTNYYAPDGSRRDDDVTDLEESNAAAEFMQAVKALTGKLPLPHDQRAVKTNGSD